MLLVKNRDEKLKKFLLVGATNVGKSTYFNRLTWNISQVGNIERVTTNAVSGSFKKDKNISFIDLPGINSLNYHSEDEAVTFKFLLEEKYDGVINIVSVNTLKRDLLLTLDLAEAGCLNMINVNMIDVAKEFKIKELALVKTFKVHVNLISAKSTNDINYSLVPLLSNNLKQPKPLIVNYADKIEKFISAFEKKVKLTNKLAKRFIVIQALLGNQTIIELFKKSEIYNDFLNCVKSFNINQNDINDILRTKQKFIDKLVKEVKVKETKTDIIVKFERNKKLTYWLDKIFLNKYLSIPLFLIIIALIWFLTFYEYTGGWIQEKLATDGLEALQGIINDGIQSLNNTSLQTWWAFFVSDGLLGGIFTVISFIPWILILVFCVSLLEQLGILSRVCVAFDRVFERFGLSGRSIVNIITGVGCNVPAILMAKNANSHKEKVVAVLVSPFITCSARVVVFGFLSQILVSLEWSWAFNFAMMIFSIVFALILGYFFSNLLFRKTSSLFLTEMVNYHKPDFYVIIKKMVIEVYEFLKRVILIVFIANFLIWLITYLGPQGYLDMNDPSAIKDSFTRYIAIPFQIILYPLGFGEHWQLPISLVTAFPAKEIAASNIETIFGGLEGFKAFASQIQIEKSTILSYLTFFSFYIPCLATIVVMKKQIGWKYTLTNIWVGLVASWIASFIVFNLSGLIEIMFINTSSNKMGNVILMVLAMLIVLLLFVYNYNWYTKQKDLSLKHKKQLQVTNYLKYILLISIIGCFIWSDVLLLVNY